MERAGMPESSGPCGCPLLAFSGPLARPGASCWPRPWLAGILALAGLTAPKEGLPMHAALLVALTALPAQTDPPIKVQETDAYIQVDTDALQARINKKGSVSGIAAGSFLGRKTGA